MRIALFVLRLNEPCANGLAAAVKCQLPLMQKNMLSSIHNPSPTLEEETSATAMFETGIKVIDLLAPLAQGGKAFRHTC